MKKTLFHLIFPLFFVANLSAQNVNISDANFKNALLQDKLINTNGDSEIQVSEAAAYSGNINVSFKSIKSLDGIEAFTKITQLDCSSNELTTFDISQNTALTSLAFSYNKFSTVNLSKNTALTSLVCSSNKLTSLDISKNTALTTLNCASNLLTTLNVSKNTALTYLYCASNSLPILNVSKNTALTSLNCFSNKLTTLDISKNTALTSLTCYSNQLTKLNLKNGVNPTLKVLDATKNPSLNCIQVDDPTKVGVNWKKRIKYNL